MAFSANQTNSLQSCDEVIRRSDTGRTSGYGAYGFPVMPRTFSSPDGQRLNLSRCREEVATGEAALLDTQDYDGVPLGPHTLEGHAPNRSETMVPQQQPWTLQQCVYPPIGVNPYLQGIFVPSVPPPFRTADVLIHPRRNNPDPRDAVEQSKRHPRERTGRSKDRVRKQAAMRQRQLARLEAARPKEKCKYYLAGWCSKSDSCPFSHDFKPPKKAELCKYYVQSRCRNGDNCVYMHSEWPCKFFHLDHSCNMGLQCKFSHKPITEETRAKLEGHEVTLRRQVSSAARFYDQKDQRQISDNSVSGHCEESDYEEKSDSEYSNDKGDSNGIRETYAGMDETELMDDGGQQDRNVQHEGNLEGSAQDDKKSGGEMKRRRRGDEVAELPDNTAEHRHTVNDASSGSGEVAESQPKQSGQQPAELERQTRWSLRRKAAGAGAGDGASAGAGAPLKPTRRSTRRRKCSN